MKVQSFLVSFFFSYIFLLSFWKEIFPTKCTFLAAPQNKKPKNVKERIPQPKNTVAMLNELRHGLIYKLDSQSGPVHAPLFTISVEVSIFILYFYMFFLCWIFLLGFLKTFSVHSSFNGAKCCFDMNLFQLNFESGVIDLA